MKYHYLFAMAMAATAVMSQAAVVQVGSGSYSDVFVPNGTNNAEPPGTPNLSGVAAAKPVPTNDWWSSQLKESFANNMFNYPMGVRPVSDGLIMSVPIFDQAIADVKCFSTGLTGLIADKVTVSDFSDWTVTFDWNGQMQATSGVGMPFIYFTKANSSDVVIEFIGQATVEGNMLLVTGSINGANYAAYAPSGSTWTVNGNKATSNLGGKNYWSAVMLPSGDAKQIGRDWAKYAFVFPGDTRAEFVYNEGAGKVETTYKVIPDVKEGAHDTFLMGLLPHHWGNLGGAVNYEGHSYATVRGELKMAATNAFKTALRYGGVLPMMPSAQNEASGYDAGKERELIDAVIANNGLVDWTDTYNDGQLLNRLVQTARIAKSIGYEAGFKKAFDLVKSRLENWLTYTSGENQYMYYYCKPWTTLLAFHAGHGQDSNINDHHFHWGYFIHAAAFIEQFEPGWARGYGEMVNLLVRDAASSDRSDNMFPYLRSFSPYAGHSWASGMSAHGPGVDQESTSESMQFNCSLIHWGAVTGNKDIRNLGVCLYAIERSATEEYWFDVHDRNLPDSYTSALVSRVFANKYDNQNFWGGGIAGSYGIQIYPVHGGSFYLVNNKEYAKKLWTAMTEETGILNNETNDNIWYDSWFQFLSMIDPAEALRLYNNCDKLGVKFGVSQAQTYQHIHSAAAIGVPRQDITANYPLATAFEKDGNITYCAQNYGTTDLTVTFSDGTTLTAKPGELAMTAAQGKRSAFVTVDLSSEKVKPGDKVTVTVSIDEGDHTISKSVVKVDGTVVNEKDHTARAMGRAAGKTHVYEWTAPETAGSYAITAEATSSEGNTFASSQKIVTVAKENEGGGDTPPVGGTDIKYDVDSKSFSVAANGDVVLKGKINVQMPEGETLSKLWLVAAANPMYKQGDYQYKEWPYYEGDIIMGETTLNNPVNGANDFTITIPAAAISKTSTTDLWPKWEATTSAGATSDGGVSEQWTFDPSKYESGGENPNPPITGDGGECVQRVDASAAGSGFLGGYTVTFKTEGSNIVVTASLDDKSAYVGLVPPYLQESGDGFREYGQMTENADGSYSYTVTDASSARNYVFKVKFAYTAGAIATTADYDYRLGQDCTSTSVGEISLDEISVYPNPASATVTVSVGSTCEVTVYSSAGIAVHSAVVESKETIDCGMWPTGVYFVRFVNEAGQSNVVTLLKR